MANFKVLVFAALLGGLAATMGLTVEKPAAESPMIVNTPVATL